MSSVVDQYLAVLNAHPLKTKMVTQGLQMLLADLISQQVSGNKKINLNSLFKMTFWGVAISAPVGHYYYAHFLTQSFNYPGAKGIIAKLLFDQLVFAPIICYVFLNYMNGFKLKESLKKLPKLMLANWKLWPMCTILQLLFFGVHTATIFGVFVGFIWGLYLTFTENKKQNQGKSNKQDTDNKV
ncbi:unnamed protein product [Moneuplotes crassus]|uniref:Peroxisomal membrane protein PMP22 n=1 Tax=Euplotes crassus TaxID=5936 RepID=A0AAD1XWL1_EUPCR|nr:unnamed protein product [Moneuplotes crassus]